MKIKKTNNYLIVTFNDTDEYLENTLPTTPPFRYFTLTFINKLNVLGVFSDTLYTNTYYPKVVIFPINENIVTDIGDISNEYVRIGSINTTNSLNDRPKYYALHQDYIDASVSTTTEPRIVTTKPIVYETSDYGTYSTSKNFYKIIIFGNKKINTIILAVGIILIVIVMFGIVYATMSTFLKFQESASLWCKVYTP